MNKAKQDKVRTKAIVNSKGEPQEARIEMPIEGSGGDLGMYAVKNLVALMNGLKEMKTEEGLTAHVYMIYGFAACCQLCGFLTEESTDSMMHTVEYLADNESVRIKAEKEGKQE